MSLFIGNLARGVNERDLEDEFVNIGECTFRFKVPLSISKLISYLIAGQLRLR